jgi:hypothetical protein
MLAVDAQRCATGDEHAQPRGGGQHLSDQRCGFEQVLEVIQNQEQALVAQPGREQLLRRLAAALLETKRLRDRGGDDLRVVDRGQAHHEDAVYEGGDVPEGKIKRQARLADAAGADQRDQAAAGAS